MIVQKRWIFKGFPPFFDVGRVIFMKIAGIVAEYNPFHSGHAYQIDRTRSEDGGGATHIAA